MTTNKIYLLQFLPSNNPATYTIGAYSSIEKILQIDTEKEFNLSDGRYEIVGFVLDSTKAKTLKRKYVSMDMNTNGWKDVK